MSWELIGKICVFGVLGFLALVGVLFFVVVRTLKRSGAYKLATHYAKNHPFVKRRIGEFVQFGWFPQGQIERSGSSGNADFRIKIEGDRGAATLHYEMTFAAGEWRLDKAVCETGGDRVVLHPPEGEPSSDGAGSDMDQGDSITAG